MPWNMQDLLASAETSKRSKILERPMSPADARVRHLGFEDWLVMTGKMDARLGEMDPVERERWRCFFIPKLRTAKFGQRTYNTEGDNG